MKKIIALVFALALIGASVTAFASNDDRGPRGQPPTFAQLDANSDGYLSKDEVKGPLAKDFDKFDADGDGFLAEEELPEPRQGQGQQKQGSM
ncbi:hypothetical protein JWG39_13160 [Desulforhopalus vacuolatus]|uniref:hypothetical protein n=1 Tax=Desulforhopalus vacuolatus TaxID=40414 RepID=UPI0019632313|nr:hypothetical protein [Desulforhopalus vacuolatus]MBM9520765.1 hypothetical protein [Desulforhopalus vacuolatus]